MTSLHRMGRPAPIEPRYSTRPMRMRSHRREHIFGKLRPMDEPDTWHWSAKLIVIAFAIPAAMLWIGVIQ